MGRNLPFNRKVKRTDKRGQKHPVREYRCENCSDCPLASKCLSRKAKARTVSRDRHEPCRERLAQRMGTEQARNDYASRAPTIEGVFGTIKGAMGIRAFWTRGIERVRTEWCWICTAYNLKKLLRLLAETPDARPEVPDCTERPATSAIAASQRPANGTLQYRSPPHPRMLEAA